MFSKEEKKERNIAFWKTFKNKMNKIPASNGKRIQWLRYPTKIKFIFVRASVNKDFAKFSIDIQAKDLEIQEIVWEQFLELKMVLENEFNEAPIWDENAINDAGKSIKQIYWQMDGVNLFNKEDEDKIMDFLKDKYIRFDSFYQEYNEILFTLLK